MQIFPLAAFDVVYGLRARSKQEETVCMTVSQQGGHLGELSHLAGRSVRYCRFFIGVFLALNVIGQCIL